MSATAEAASIGSQAQRGTTSVVTLGPLVFFSTGTGDAWVLDPADFLARCLARDGEPLPPGIIDTAEIFSVEWTHTYSIDGSVMIFADSAGVPRCVLGYPAHEIQEATRRCTVR